MMINKDELKRIVELYYRTNYKIFTVNSIDGFNLVKSPGEFISLGITTSQQVLETVRDLINSTSQDYKAEIAEMSSMKYNSNIFKFLNTITKTEGIEKYKNTIEISGNLLNETAAREELEALRNSGQLEAANKLYNLIHKLDVTVDGWNSHSIEKQNNDDYVLYYNFVNYKVDVNDIEYRIGIYVTEK